MSDNKYAVQVKNVKKSFYLPNHRNDSLKRSITEAFKPKDKGINTFHALDGISFNVEKGDFFGILGRNGSGKSTLLKIIAEIYQPTAGNVIHDGKIVSFIELGVGFKDDLSGKENVFLNGAMLGFSKKEIEAMYDEIVGFAELEQFMDQRLKNYSSGMKVRLAFSVAIRAKADILILDEVLAVGDADFQRKCNDYFTTLKDDKKTVILVTHSMGNVRKYCNKAVVIEGGKVIFEGGSDEAADTYLSLFRKDTPAEVKPKKKKDKKKDLNLDKKVTIENVTTHITQKKIEIDIILKSDTSEKDVKLAVRILNTQKKAVAGINTRSIDKPTSINFTDSNIVKVKFTLDNIIGSGTFTLDVIAGPTVVTGIYHDRVNDVAPFTNAQPEGHYPVIAPASIEVTNT